MINIYIRCIAFKLYIIYINIHRHTDTHTHTHTHDQEERERRSTKSNFFMFGFLDIVKGWQKL